MVVSAPVGRPKKPPLRQRKGDGKWVSSSLAVAVLTENLGVKGEARRLLEEAIRKGQVTCASARRVHVQQTCTEHECWRLLEKENFSVDLIERNLWVSQPDFDDDQDYHDKLNLDTGRLILREEDAYHFMDGLHVLISDLNKLIPRFGTTVIGRDNGGRLPNKDSWSKLAVLLVEMQRDGTIDGPKHKKATSLVDDIVQRLKVPFDRKVLYDIVSKIRPGKN